MAIKGKRVYRVYLDEEDTEYIKSFLKSKRGTGGLSAILNKIIVALAAILRESGAVKPGAKLNWTRFIRMVFSGATKGI